MVKDNIIPNHMNIYWHDYTGHVKDKPITEASLPVKAALIGRVGLMLLSCGTGAWRVRSSMNALSEQLGVTCTASIGLMTIVYTCFDGNKTFTNSLALNNTGVNTSKLNQLERFVKKFPQEGVLMSGEQLHSKLDEIEKIRGLYTPLQLGLAAAVACAAFTFLLGGGPIEMLCAFIGAGAGNYLRCHLIKRHFTLYLCIISSVALACLSYTVSLRLLETFFSIPGSHEAGYICAMLYIIPGFPFITSGIDLAKLDMRSGLERLAYAVIIVVTATITGWVMSTALNLHPADFADLNIPPALHLILRLAASFAGVFGFSIMFNSPVPIASAAALIGAVANTLRLELVELAALPAAVAAFLGALTAGLLASFLMKRLGYPRISVTVPSIVIMVPGLYLYRAVYNMGEMSLALSANWLVSALLIIMMLPLGLICARIITDRSFRHCT
ncbi:MAG TPA: threonine/serine exporter family protein [Candidatus Mediterraneibacter stercoravium]|uniref:Threonine/serine exporter family protein n=1 Tax=Candidatus Mediterraneibacter stercoravium TaxID=2838685 RepID=A0A9D2GBP6_9FIRM|nr:threonine/serine exporter family protein [Candidatus Mediterraneibacter stercoravium]